MSVQKAEQYLDQLQSGNVEQGLKNIQNLISDPTVADELKFELANYLYESGFVHEAIDALENLHALYPNEPEITLSLAEYYAEVDRDEESISLLNAFEPGDEDYIRASLLSAEIYLMQGLFEVAEYKVKKALEQEPNSKLLFQALAEIYYEQEDYSTALFYYQKGTHTPYGKLAECYAHIGQWEEALQAYEQALQQEEVAEWLFGYGFVSYQLQKWPQTIEKLSRLIDVDPHFTSAYPFLIKAYGKEKEFEKAIETADLGLQYDETNPELFYLKGLLLQQAGKTDEAVNMYNKVLTMDDAHEESFEQLYEISKERGEYEAARSYVERLTELMPERLQYIYDAAELYEELELWDQAIESYERLLQMDIDNIEVMNKLALLLRDEGRMNEAVQLWKRSIQIDPSQFDIHDLLDQYAKNN